MSRYLVTDPANRDLADILERIAMDNSGAARRMGNRFITTFELIAHSPKIGQSFGSSTLGVRRINEGLYEILFREGEEEVEILRVFHGMQNLDLLFDA